MMYTVKISFKVITKIPLMKKTTVTIDEETKKVLVPGGADIYRVTNKDVQKAIITSDKNTKDTDKYVKQSRSVGFTMGLQALGEFD